MKIPTLHELKPITLTVPPEVMARVFQTQPEIATDGATVTTDGSRDHHNPVDNDKEGNKCRE